MIGSSYVALAIFDYIKDENYLYEFIRYSKKNQERFGITKEHYKQRYFEKIGVNYLHSYLNYYYDFIRGRYKNIDLDGFDKDILYRKLKTDWSKYKFDMKVLAEYIYSIHKYINDIEKSALPIDIYSPFLFYLSRKEKFNKIFFIPISGKIINDFNLKDDYIKVFKQLYLYNSPKLNVHFLWQNDNDIQYLTDFKIFSKIKRLNVKDESTLITSEIINYKNFFKLLFSPKNIKGNNLVYLDIKINKRNHRINAKNVESLNKFELIKHLKLDGFKFKQKFYLKLKQLKSLKLRSCTNITFDENSCSNLEKMILEYSQIVQSESLLNFYILNELEGSQIFSDIINFKSLEKLQKFKGEAYDFIHLENTLLEEITLSSSQKYSQEIEQKMINKIISMKTLKTVYIPLLHLHDEKQFLKGYNNSVKDVTIKLENNDNNNFVKYNSSYFSRTLELSLFEKIYSKRENKNVSRIIIGEEEDYYSNLLHLSLFSNNSNVILNIPCKKLKTLRYSEYGENKVTFEFEKKNSIFKSLIEFSGRFKSPLYLETINDIFNNKDKVPNLKIFIIRGELRDEINEDLYLQFIAKLLELRNLEEIEINIEIIKYENVKLDDSVDNGPMHIYKFRKYLEKELTDLFPNINFRKFKSISISNLDSPPTIEVFD
jgi:hypothetical protein